MEELFSLIKGTLIPDFLNHVSSIDRIAEILRQSEELDLKKLVSMGQDLDKSYFFILDLDKLALIRSAYDGIDWDANFPYVFDFIFEYLEMVVGLKSLRRWNSTIRKIDFV